MGYSGLLPPPLPYFPMKQINDISHKFKPLSIEIMRDMIYNKDSDLNSMELKTYNGEKTQTIENMLEAMYKLTLLASTMKKFDEAHVKTHVQPFFDSKQQFRCYLSDTYIVVEVSTDTKISGGWRHIIENHGANEKDSARYYDFQIIPNLSDKTHQKITEGINMVVETVEQHIFDIMNKTNTIFEQVNTIRIGPKDKEEIIREERIRYEENKKIREEEEALKKMNKVSVWDKVLKISPKITFT